MRKFIILGVLLSIGQTLYSQTDLLINTQNRIAQSLNGDWHYIIDPYENGYYNYRYEPFDQMDNPSKGAFFLNSKPSDKTDLVEYDFDASDVLAVPGDWNTQKPELLYYEGTVWYEKTFDYEKKANNNRVFLYFGAVNYEAEVYLNGKKLGTHLGGFTPFNYEITELVKENNFVVVKVDNKRKKEGVPTLNTDWWNYGGITRDVKVIETPENYIADYLIQLDKSDANLIAGFVQLKGSTTSGKEITLEIPELKIKKTLTTNSEGRADLQLKAKKINYWSPENPKLYEVKLAAGEDHFSDKIGFRTITTQGSDILLNGKSVFLRGISIHEEKPYGGGRASSKEDDKQLLTWAKELGCNYVRLAHYPHNENMVRLADEMGIMVWEEIPVYWTIDWENKATYDNAINQLETIIRRDKNRAATIIWSMANETPVKEVRTAFLTKLATRARELDPTRLISAALEQSGYQGQPNTKTIHDPFADVVDVLSFNQYIGWYGGLPDLCEKINWHIEQNKPVIVSEFGAGAKYGYHADSLTRWSEEYQAYLYRETLKMLDRVDKLRGFSPWILVDFRSPRRPLPKIQDGWNRKGLISEQGEKKKAFYVLQQYYSQKGQQ